MTKIVAYILLAIAVCTLGYVGAVNYVLYDWVSQGAEVVNPSKFFNEQCILLFVGVAIGVPSYVYVTKKEQYDK
jgi:hypothetical protein